jgi:hypothetical protein
MRLSLNVLIFIKFYEKKNQFSFLFKEIPLCYIVSVSAFEPTPYYSALELVRATHDPQQLSLNDNWRKSCGFNLRAGRLVSLPSSVCPSVCLSVSHLTVKTREFFAPDLNVLFTAQIG